MIQPELGRKISELRNQKGLTQKELSDSCGIDIRTIQRIEAGEVIPRPSTLKLISNALDFDIYDFGIDKPAVVHYSTKTLIFYLIVGALYLIAWILYAPLFPKGDFLMRSGLSLSMIFSVISLIFYFGFFDYGKKTRNVFLKISSLIILISVPISLFFTLIYDQFGFSRILQQITIAIMGLNSIAFGIGLLRIKRKNDLIKNIAGILQLCIAPFFIFPVSILNYVGCWMTIPFALLLISMIVQTYLETKNGEHALES